jgi:hypothetical protein
MKTISILYLLLALSYIVDAQEIGISPVKIWTTSYELQNPIGVGISLGKNINIFKLRLEYIHVSNDRSYYGHLQNMDIYYNGYARSENINSSSSLTAYEISLNLSQKIYNNYNFYSGVGLTFDRYKLKRSGLSSGDSYNVESDWRHGFFAAFAFTRDNFVFQQITLEILFKIKSITPPSYPEVYSSFDDITIGKELQLNLVYSFE